MLAQCECGEVGMLCSNGSMNKVIWNNNDKRLSGLFKPGCDTNKNGHSIKVGTKWAYLLVHIEREVSVGTGSPG